MLQGTQHCLAGPTVAATLAELTIIVAGKVPNHLQLEVLLVLLALHEHVLAGAQEGSLVGV